MAIVTISRGSYSRGKEIAEKVAVKLGYECINREAIIEASEQFHIPEIKLARAIHDAPSILERFGYGKEKYVAYFQTALLHHVKKDNVVYHGLAGHYLLECISHVLKVRIISDMGDRIALEMERENISRKEAERILKSDDEQRRRWSRYLCGLDTQDPSSYDMVLHIKTLTPDDAVDLICHTVGLPHFQTTPESQKILDDLVLASQVKGEIVKQWPNVEVTADSGCVVIHIEAPVLKEAALRDQIAPLVRKVSGVKDVRMHVRPSTFLGTY